MTIVQCKLRLKRPPAPVVSFHHRDLKNVNINALRLHLASSALVTAPSDDPHVCMDSFLGDTVAALDKGGTSMEFLQALQSLGQSVAVQ